MLKLIETLKNEHKALFITLDNLKKNEIKSREWKDSLAISKNIILTHLKKEDEQLYPVLTKIAEQDSKFKLTLDIFAYDMENISQYAFSFFDKYPSNKNLSGFNSDLDKLYNKLHSRVRNEEEVIYPKYKESMLVS